MKKRKKHTFGQLLRIANIIDRDIFEESLKNVRRPERLCGEKVPENLNEANYGMICSLGSLPKEETEAAFAVCSIVLGLNRSQVLKAPADDVIGFVMFINKEMEQINKLFASVSIPMTDEQKRAGAESLNFGVFGTLDWYARRMGIKNHDDVLPVSWLRIYQCLKMDNEMELYNRRLNKIYQDKYKTK